MIEGLNTIEEAVEDIKKGRAVIVVDDEDRENEGDFIASAELITPEMINFIASKGRGLICVALEKERCLKLNLSLMVSENTATHFTNFTVTVDLKGNGCTTGISAQDRAKTVKALVNSSTKPEDLGRPGHIFPIQAHPDGVIGRQGHTEATIELSVLAGHTPGGVLVEILNEDGTMARLPQLLKISAELGVKIITIKDLISYVSKRH